MKRSGTLLGQKERGGWERSQKHLSIFVTHQEEVEDSLQVDLTFLASSRKTLSPDRQSRAGRGVEQPSMGGEYEL